MPNEDITKTLKESHNRRHLKNTEENVMDYYRLVTESPKGSKSLGDSLYTHAEFIELMADYERCEWTGVWSSDDGFEYWPVLSNPE